MKCDTFYSCIEDAYQLIPHVYVEMTSNDKPWVTPTLKHLINKRYEAFRQKNYSLYEHYKVKVESEIVKAKNGWISKMKEQKRNIWEITRNIRGKRNDDICNILRSSPKETANRINKQFTETFTERTKRHELLQSINGNHVSWNPDTSVANVRKLIQSLNTKKAPGSDNVTPRILVESCDVLEGPIAHLFSVSVKEKTVPSQWKIANILPIPKKKNPTIQDLRPISLLPVVSKLFEKCVLDSIKEQILKLFGNCQFAYRPNSSTLHAQIYAHEIITLYLERPNIAGVAMVSFDLSRAFDSLQYKKLFESLTGHLPTDFLKWLVDYFDDRKQRVLLKGDILSDVEDVTSGVPQGAVLSAYLFAAHMGSLNPFYHKNHIIKYADDVALFIPYPDESYLENVLQAEVKNISDWCQKNGLCLNQTKTKMIQFRKKTSTSQKLSLSGIPILNALKFLGITFQSNLRWDLHVSRICKLASQRVYLMKKLRRYPSITRKDMLQIYHAHILGVLEFNSPVLIGMSKRNSDKLERIRKRCHNVICQMHCKCHSFPTLESRRRNRALKFFKQMRNPSDILHSLSPEVLPKSGHVKLPLSTTTRRSSSFIPRCSILYNRRVRPTF